MLRYPLLHINETSDPFINIKQIYHTRLYQNTKTHTNMFRMCILFTTNSIEMQILQARGQSLGTFPFRLLQAHSQSLDTSLPPSSLRPETRYHPYPPSPWESSNRVTTDLSSGIVRAPILSKPGQSRQPTSNGGALVPANGGWRRLAAAGGDTGVGGRRRRAADSRWKG